MTEEKLYTIDELMEGKAPGSVQMTLHNSVFDSRVFSPYFQVGCYWHGVDRDDVRFSHRMEHCKIRGWKLYTEPKKKKVLRPAIYKTGTGQYCVSHAIFETDEQARESFSPAGFVRMAPDSYAVEVEE